MINTINIVKKNESSRHFSKGKFFIINTILTYKTTDGYTGYIVRIKEDRESSN